MTRTTCPLCCNYTTWRWEEAFKKCGFDSGDGVVMTEHVADALRKRNYIVHATAWGRHNVVIISIKKGKKELIPSDCEWGYDNPRTYLPKRIVQLLDKTFTDDAMVEL